MPESKDERIGAHRLIAGRQQPVIGHAPDGRYLNRDTLAGAGEIVPEDAQVGPATGEFTEVHLTRHDPLGAKIGIAKLGGSRRVGYIDRGLGKDPSKVETVVIDSTPTKKI